MRWGVSGDRATSPANTVIGRAITNNLLDSKDRFGFARLRRLRRLGGEALLPGCLREAVFALDVAVAVWCKKGWLP